MARVRMIPSPPVARTHAHPVTYTNTGGATGVSAADSRLGAGETEAGNRRSRSGQWGWGWGGGGQGRSVYEHGGVFVAAAGPVGVLAVLCAWWGVRGGGCC